MNAAPEFHTTRFVRKVSTSSSAGTVLVIVGLAALLAVNWILGVILIIGGLLLTGGSKKISTCGECGNEVSNTSRICPHCSAGFNRVKTIISNATIYACIGILTAGGLISALIWWVTNQVKH